MRLIIHAVNIHQGGGRTLLLSLLPEIKVPAILLLDERLNNLPAFGPHIQVTRIGPSTIQRFKAELKLRALSRTDDIILCMGNLPPLLKNPGQVFVYLQNRYLCTSHDLQGFHWKIRLRILGERLWLRYFLRQAQLIVQTETMRQSVKAYLGRDASVLPFLPAASAPSHAIHTSKRYDFLYVASGEPHKNHRQLVNAWVILAEKDIRPTLCLTLDEKSDAATLHWIADLKNKYTLHISNNSVPSDQVCELYAQSAALIYPSLLESFGLPLLEATSYGLTILASEKDYVRDVIQPHTTFDPESALSIARAVERHLHLDQTLVPPQSPANFLHTLTAPLAR